MDDYAGGTDTLDVSRAYDRSWPLADIEIMRSGGGKTVTAYAAVFNRPQEIRDQHGHYTEVIHRNAFDAVIGQGIDRILCLYNHGMNLDGSPNGQLQVPIGSPLDIRADNRGLRTVTRFNDGPTAENVLAAIRAGDVKGYSFRGAIKRSDPHRVPPRYSGPPPTVTRLELGLSEYGPTPLPYYKDASIESVRNRQDLALMRARLHLKAHDLGMYPSHCGEYDCDHAIEEQAVRNREMNRIHVAAHRAGMFRFGRCGRYGCRLGSG